MIQEDYQKAILFAGEKHAEQTVPGTIINYVVHLSNVAMEVMQAHAACPDFDLSTAVQIALLHDSIEDTSTTFNVLKNTFNEQIALGVKALTKDANLLTKEERMQDSLNRILREKKEVAIVKLADRITNLQKPPVHWPAEKIKNYHKEAQLILSHLAQQNDYLANRLRNKIKAYENFFV